MLSYMKMWGLTRKLCFGSSSVPILSRARAFCSSSSSSSTKAPLLMIHTQNLFTTYRNGRLNDSSYPYCLFSLADMDPAAGTNKNKTRVLLPEDNLSPLEKHEFFPDDLRFIGSSHGWVGCINPRDLKLFLFNPLSPSDSMTLLPPLQRLRHRDSVSYYKLIMSAPPSDPNCTVLAAHICGFHEPCFWKPGDTSWTPLPVPADYGFGGLTILSSDHRRCFYFFHLTGDCGVLDAWDPSDPGSPVRTTVEIGPVITSLTAEFQYHLAESPSGDLFLVVKELFGGKLNYGFVTSIRTHYPNYLGLRPEDLMHDFCVLKLDLSSLEENGRDYNHRRTFLGGDALFLGKNDSFWVSGRDFPVVPNSIYFTEPDYSSHSEFDAFDPAQHGGCDMLIFRCDRDTSEATSRYYFRDAKKKNTEFTPIWVMPCRSESSPMTERFVATPEYKPKKIIPSWDEMYDSSENGGFH